MSHHRTTLYWLSCAYVPFLSTRVHFSLSDRSIYLKEQSDGLGRAGEHCGAHTTKRNIKAPSPWALWPWRHCHSSHVWKRPGQTVAITKICGAVKGSVHEYPQSSMAAWSGHKFPYYLLHTKARAGSGGFWSSSWNTGFSTSGPRVQGKLESFCIFFSLITLGENEWFGGQDLGRRNLDQGLPSLSSLFKIHNSTSSYRISRKW